MLAVATQLEASVAAGGSGGASESCEASPEETARGPGTRTPRTVRSWAGSLKRRGWLLARRL